VGQFFAKKWKFLPFWELHSHPSAPIGVKFFMTKWTHMLLCCAKFHMNWYNQSPLRAKMLIFRLSKFNTGSLQLCGNPASKYPE